MGASPQPLLLTRLSMFRGRVPRRARFWLLVLFALFYQLCGGVYLAALSQMVGGLSFLSEDVTMAGYCSLIGLNMIFPVLFRWKFGLYTRQMFFVSAGGSIACAVVAMYTSVAWVLWLVCFAAGYFKMMGMFGCMSTIQLNITPSRNFGAFFPVVYILVCGAIQLSGLMTAYVTYSYDWRMVYCVIVCLMLFVEAVTYFLMKPDHRSGPYIPLKGIDWTGFVLWSALCGVCAWLFAFGEHYDWWDSRQVWQATWLALALLAVTLVHQWRKGQPYISLRAFRYPVTWTLMFMLFGIAVLEASAHVLQPVYLNVVAGYDYYTIVGFNYPEIFGIAMGAILSYFAFVRLHWPLRVYFCVTFVLVTYYIVVMYFLIGPDTEAYMYYPAMFALGAGEIMMEAGATYVLSQMIPFPHFFMNISIIGFVRCGVGSAAASAVVEHLFAWAGAKYAAEPVAAGWHGAVPDGWLRGQHLMLALKECYGYLALVGVALTALTLAWRYRTALRRFVPRIVAVARWVRSPHRTPDPTLSGHD